MKIDNRIFNRFLLALVNVRQEVDLQPSEERD